MANPVPRVLFLCTGNYYRSRFAEAVFNHAATEAGSPWRAFSRGLAIHLAPPGPLSPHTIAALGQRGIPVSGTAAEPQAVTEADLQQATLTVALKEAEHRPYLARQFPAWQDRVEYWHFHDIDFAAPDEVLPAIEVRVRHLVDRLNVTKPASTSAGSL